MANSGSMIFTSNGRSHGLTFKKRPVSGSNRRPGHVAGSGIHLAPAPHTYTDTIIHYIHITISILMPLSLYSSSPQGM